MSNFYFSFYKTKLKEKDKSHLYHSYSNDSLKINYLIPPFEVTLPKKMILVNISRQRNSDKKVIYQNRRIYITTDYYDSNNIFDSYNIEEKTTFNTTITINPNNKPRYYNITCKLWNPKNINLIIICQVNNTNILKESSFQGYFNETIINYNDYRVIISPDILLKY